MYHVCYDGGHFCDGFEVDTLDLAKQSCIDILTGWTESFLIDNHISDPVDVVNSSDLSDKWDTMIQECWVYVCDSDDPDWYSCWSPQDSDLYDLKWMYSYDLKEVFSHE